MRNERVGHLADYFRISSQRHCTKPANTRTPAVYLERSRAC